MDPLEQFIASMRARIADMLAGLPPEAQLDAASAPGVAAKSCRRFGAEMETIFTEFKRKAGEISQMGETKKAELITAAKSEAIKDLAFMTASGFITKSDHETALQVAVDTQKQQQTAEVEKALKTVAQTAERRKKLVTDKVLIAAAAEALPDEVLQGDDYLTKVGTLKTTRLDKLATIKALAADTGAISKVLTLPMTAEGDAAFKESFEIWERASKAGGTGGNPLGNPPGGAAGDGPVTLF